MIKFLGGIRLVGYRRFQHHTMTIIGDPVVRVVSSVLEVGRNIVIGKLEFRKKKAALKGDLPKYSYVLSSFSYGRGEEENQVNLAFSSVIGRVMFMERTGSASTRRGPSSWHGVCSSDPIRVWLLCGLRATVWPERISDLCPRVRVPGGVVLYCWCGGAVLTRLQRWLTQVLLLKSTIFTTVQGGVAVRCWDSTVSPRKWGVCFKYCCSLRPRPHSSM